MSQLMDPSTVMSKPALARVGEALASDPRAFLSVHDANGVFTFVTSSVSLLTGLRSSQLTGTYSFYDLVHPHDRDAVREAHRISAHPPVASAITFRIVHADGTTTQVVGQSWGTADSTGELESIVCLTTPES